MTKLHLLARLVLWTIFLFMVLEVARQVEHNATIAAGCQSSSAFAQSIADAKQWARDEKAKDPAGMQRTNHQMAVARFRVHGITAVILASIVVWSSASIKRPVQKEQSDGL